MEEAKMVKNIRNLLFSLIVLFWILFAPNDYILNAHAEAKAIIILSTIRSKKMILSTCSVKDLIVRLRRSLR